MFDIMCDLFKFSLMKKVSKWKLLNIVNVFAKSLCNRRIQNAQVQRAHTETLRLPVRITPF
jgi:hypothetical protein